MNHPEELTKTTPNHIIKWVLKERQQLALRAWEVWMDAGGPGPVRGVRALGCWFGASLSQGHMASPDPSQSGERVWGRWPDEVGA